MVDLWKDMKNNAGRLFKKGSFIQNVSIVFSGNVISFILQLIFAPIISRIYGPEAYGEFAYYNLVVTNIIFMGSMSLPTVYVLPKTKLEFLALGKIVVIAVFSITILSLIIFLPLEGTFIDRSVNLWYIPILFAIITTTTINSILNSWNVRNKKFKRNSTVTVLSNLIGKISTLGYGYTFSPSGIGLVSGNLFMAVFAFFFQNSLMDKKLLLGFLYKKNWGFLRTTFKKNFNVVRYIFPSQFLNKITSDLPILIIGGYYNTEFLGYYTFALTILNIPQNMIANAVQPVFFQKANELRMSNRESLNSFVQLVYRYSLTLSIPIITIIFFAEGIFALVFGNEWLEAGTVTTLLGIFVIFQTIVTPIGGIRRIFRQEKRIFTFSIISIIFKISPLILTLFNFDFYTVVFWFAISNSIFIIVNVADILYICVSRRDSFIWLSYSLSLLIITGLLVHILYL